MKKARVAAIQFDSKSKDKNENVSKAIELLKVAAKENVDIAVLPKDFSVCYPITQQNILEGSETIPGATTALLAEQARKHKMYIVGGTITEKEGKRIYDTSPLLGPEGKLIGKYRRVHLMGGTDNLLLPGMDYPVFETDVGTIGILIGPDVDFPEPARVLALKGADIVFWVGGFRYMWIDVCRLLEQSQAYMNSVYMVKVNRTGALANGDLYFGDSCIINPMGEVIASAGTSYGTLFPEGMAIATLDLESLHKTREQPTHLFKLRKPETYSLLTEK